MAKVNEAELWQCSRLSPPRHDALTKMTVFNTSAHEYATLFCQAALAQKKAVAKRGRALSANLLQRRPEPRATERSPPSVRSAHQQRGDLYEALAQEHLERAGCVVLARQLRCPAGELDLVVRDRSLLVFVEVRQRTSSLYGGASASVTSAKQRRILRAAHWFLAGLVERHFGGTTPYCRIDVLAFEPAGLAWHRDAFRLT
jgi:putative endonuclease